MFKMNTADFEHNNLVESAILNWLDCGGLGTKVCGGLLAEAGARFSKVPVTLRARNQIFKSKYKE